MWLHSFNWPEDFQHEKRNGPENAGFFHLRLSWDLREQGSLRRPVSSSSDRPLRRIPARLCSGGLRLAAAVFSAVGWALDH